MSVEKTGLLVNRADASGALPQGTYWGFYDTAQAWYSKGISKQMDDEEASSVSLGIYHADGGSSGECSCRWRRFESQRPPAFELTIFSDALEAYSTAPEFVAALMAGGKLWNDKGEFLSFLESAGIYDLTKRAMATTDQEVLAMAIERQRALRLAVEIKESCVARVPSQPAKKRSAL